MSIFVTDTYSVENYIVTKDAVEQIWAEIFRQSSGKTIGDALKKKFTEGLNVIHAILIELMSWVLWHRRKGNKPNLDNIKTTDLFEIKADLSVHPKVARNKFIPLLDEKTKTITTIDDIPSIIQCRNELARYAPKYVIRGHNEMDFFVEFIKKLPSIVESRGGKIKSNVAITSSNIIDIMGPRVRIPDSLNHFLCGHIQRQLQT